VTAPPAPIITTAFTTATTTVDAWTRRLVEAAEEPGAGEGGRLDFGSPDDGELVVTSDLDGSTKKEKEPSISEELTRDAGLLVGFAILSFMVSVLLASLLASHLPLALTNLTTIEENYENMPNPFDHGTYMKNLGQILGQFGVDWFLPIMPRHPLSDGVSYPRPGEPVLPIDGFRPEEIWKFRYVAIPAQQQEPEESSLSTGLFGRLFSTGFT
jgi:hypothetical protein